MCELPPAGQDDLDALTEIDTADELLDYLDRLDVPPIARASGPHCRHLSIRLVPAARRVFCRECETELDPFTALLTFTDQWERYQRQLQQLKVDVYLKQGELFELKQKENTLRERQKREEA